MMPGTVILVPLRGGDRYRPGLAGGAAASVSNSEAEQSKAGLTWGILEPPQATSAAPILGMKVLLLSLARHLNQVREGDRRQRDLQQASDGRDVPQGVAQL